MRKWLTGLLAACLLLTLTMPVCAALPSGTGIVTSCKNVSGSEFTSRSSLAKKLDSMFAGNIGLYKNSAKTKLVDAALGTRNVPNNGVYQYWGSRAGTSCYAYANAFYAHFYDGTYPHGSLNSNHQKIKATGKISYANFQKWGVRDDAVVYIREGNHSVIVLCYDENYITYADGNGDGKGLIAIRKEAWKRGSGTNIYNSKPSLIVQPRESYFAAGSMGKAKTKPCTQGGTAHDWDDGVVTQKATCKEAGVKVYTCADCQKTKEESVSKTDDHTYGAWTVTKAATCTEKGQKSAVCTLCGKEKTKTLKALGHDYGKTVTVKEATIYACGKTEKTCDRCGKVKKTTTDCTFRDGSITLTAKKGAFPQNTEILIAEETADYAELLQDVTGKFAVYALSALKNKEPVQPEKSVTLSLQIPEGFGENLALYLVTEGEKQLLESALEAGVLTAQLEQLGVFALCDLDVPFVPATAPETQPVTVPTTQPVTQPVTTVAAPAVTPEETSTEVLLLALGAVLPVTAAVTLAVTLIIKKRKEHACPAASRR